MSLQKILGNDRSYPPPVNKTHVGHTVTARKLDPEEDVDALYEASHGEYAYLWQYTLPGPFPNKEDMLEWLKDVGEMSTSRVYHVITHNHEKYVTAKSKEEKLGRPVGMFALLQIAPHFGSVEIGNIWYCPKYQGTSVNTEAAQLLMRYCFDELGYRRVEWKCHCKNNQSVGAALRLGFKFEGLFRKHMLLKNANRDTAYFAITDDEWPQIRDVIQRWLDETEAVRASGPDSGGAVKSLSSAMRELRTQLNAEADAELQRLQQMERQYLATGKLV
eukprot:GFYU01018638.1.p1 GENE.GFYU01018638.1~~GFYU01018638.1.p1  ORF type:complete len:275 (-),score=57.36 GFYU01018638.1:74-898(-)